MMALLRRMRIKLNDGEVICSRCKGSGYEKRRLRWGTQEKLSCALCDARGKVDWIRNVVGPDYAIPQQYWIQRSFLRIAFDWLSTNLFRCVIGPLLAIPFLVLTILSIYGF